MDEDLRANSGKTGSADTNPYAAPAPLQEIEPPPPPSEMPRAPYGLWVVAVLINLPAPTMLGIAVSSGFGRIGMPVGVVLVAAVGVLMCQRFPTLMRRLSRGSMLTALSQMSPALHFAVGSVAISVAQLGRGGGDLDGIIQVTVATVVTGIGLILPSIAFGYGMSAIGSFFRRRDKP